MFSISCSLQPYSMNNPRTGEGFLNPKVPVLFLTACRRSTWRRFSVPWWVPYSNYHYFFLQYIVSLLSKGGSAQLLVIPINCCEDKVAMPALLSRKRFSRWRKWGCSLCCIASRLQFQEACVPVVNNLILAPRLHADSSVSEDVPVL